MQWCLQITSLSRNSELARTLDLIPMVLIARHGWRARSWTPAETRRVKEASLGTAIVC